MRLRTIGAVLCISMMSANMAAAKPSTLVRDEIDSKFKWDLTDLYADWNSWEADKANVVAMLDKIAEYKGTLNQGSEHLATVLKDFDDLYLKSEHVYVYPMLKSVEDTRINSVQAKLQEATLLDSRIAEATSWYLPELISLGKETVMGWVAENEKLAPYAYNLNEIFRTQKHVLDAATEELLSYAGPLENSVSDSYMMLSAADVQFPTITLSDGSEIVCTQGNYMSVLRNNKYTQEDRRAATAGHYSIYDELENSYASVANSIFQRNWFQARTHHYNTTLEMVLDRDGIPVEVYKTLVETAKKGSAPLQRYHQIRKQVMELDTYRYHDAYLSIVENNEVFDYDRARELVIASVKPLGKEYQKSVERAFEEGWVDVYENEGKESGAFNQGMYDVHPYVKLNYSDTMNDVFTVAHELGHSLHSVYSSKNQPYATANYATFIAEVASTLCEHLVMDEMMDQIKDPTVRIALLQESIDAIAGTFYRQAMFADYEYKAHTLVEQGKPITAKVLQDLYVESQSDFFGTSLDDHELYRNTWAYVSHFFFTDPYYVFQYATSLSASTKIHKDMTTGKKKDRKAARERYIELISSGASDNPVVLLNNAGVDMTSTETYQAIVEEMDRLVAQLEEELKKIGKL